MLVVFSILFSGSIFQPPSPPSGDGELPQVSIHAIGWNGEYWLIGGNTFRIFEDGFSPCPLLVEYSNDHFADLSSQFDIGDKIIDSILWNGEYWLIAYSFHEYGGLLRYDGEKFSNIPLPGSPQSLRVAAIDWNGEYWLIGGGYIGYGYLIQYDGASTNDLTLLSGISAVRSITWIDNFWLISGTDAERVEMLVKYNGYTFEEVEYPAFVGSINTACWNGEYLLVSDDELMTFDGTEFENTTFNGRRIFSLSWNGEYWLIGGEDGMLTMFDGTTFTDLKGEAEFSSSIKALAWNGKYWLIGDTGGTLKIYDGEEFTELTAKFVDALPGSLQPIYEPAASSGPMVRHRNATIVIILLIISLCYFLAKKLRR